MTGLVRQAVRALGPDAEAAGVEIAMAESAERVVLGDADSIIIALVNVLRNAIEASPGGGKVNVAMSNGGRVRVTNLPGKGARFELVFVTPAA